MSLHLRHIIYSLCLVFLSAPLWSQISAYQKELSRLYEVDRIDDVRLFEGSLDKVHHIQMVLGVHDNTVLGYYEFVKTRLRFELEGEYKENILELIETDQDDQTSGYFILKDENESLSGEWSHINHETKIFTQLNRVNNFKNKSICKKNNWTKNYNGVLDGGNVELSLVTIGGQLEQAYFSLENIRFLLPIEQINKNEYSANMTAVTSLYESMIIKYQADNTCDITLLKDGQSMFATTLKLYDELNFECFEEMEYATSIKAVYPVISEVRFNEWIGNEITQWSKVNQNEMSNLLANDPGLIPSDRYKYEANIWVDIHLFSKQFISGLITYQCSWKSSNKREAFIFDRAQKSFVDPSNLFNGNQNKFFENLISRHKIEYPPFQEKLIRKWLENQNFDHISLTQDGVNLNTEFSTIFGSKTIFVPFAELGDYFSKNYKSSFIKK